PQSRSPGGIGHEADPPGDATRRWDRGGGGERRGVARALAAADPPAGRGRPDRPPRLFLGGGGSDGWRAALDHANARRPCALSTEADDGRGAMSDLLERSIRNFPAPPSLTLDRVTRRRDRKRRNRRIVSAVMALLLAIAVTVTVARTFRTAHRTAPAGIDLR